MRAKLLPRKNSASSVRKTVGLQRRTGMEHLSGSALCDTREAGKKPDLVVVLEERLRVLNRVFYSSASQRARRP